MTGLQHFDSRQRKAFFLIVSRPGLGPTQFLYPAGTGGSFLGRERWGDLMLLESASDHPPSTNAKINNTWVYTSIFYPVDNNI